MCNLYSMTRSRAAIVAIIDAMRDRSDNQPPLSGINPDYAAPIVAHDPDGVREVRDARWGMPTPRNILMQAATKRADKLRAKGQEVDFQALVKAEPDRGVTNVRNTDSRHWRPWLGPENRCLVPFTSFSEPDQVGGSKKPIWFALDESRPLAFFAGIRTPWTCVRKISEGEVTCELFAFLTTEAHPVVAQFHDKATPVILTEPEQWDQWLGDGAWADVAHLQAGLPADALRVVARDVRSDSAPPRTVLGP
jgi:putative SOS response-associated peptidase YedK